jgi:hypothetical protein
MDAGKLEEAAMWLATGGRDTRRATVPQLRERYGFTTSQAVAAIRQAKLMRAK